MSEPTIYEYVKCYDGYNFLKCGVDIVAFTGQLVAKSDYDALAAITREQEARIAELEAQLARYKSILTSQCELQALLDAAEQERDQLRERVGRMEKALCRRIRAGDLSVGQVMRYTGLTIDEIYAANKRSMAEAAQKEA
jgi:cell division septum initiation protein DivIVA